MVRMKALGDMTAVGGLIVQFGRGGEEVERLINSAP
jgi:hypothetical protein